MGCGMVRDLGFYKKMMFFKIFHEVISKVSIRILLKNISVQFNDKYSLNHLCNHLITKHYNSISMPLSYHPICAKLGVNDNMTCCRKTGILDILKRETRQGKIELSHCAR